MKTKGHSQKRIIYQKVGLAVFTFILLFALVAPPLTPAQPVQVFNPDKTIDTWASGGDPQGLPPYHPQVTAYFCGAAAMEMELDCNAIRNNNAVLDTMLGAGVAGATPGAVAVDGVPQACFPGGFCWLPAGFRILNINNANVNVPVSNVQTFMYGLCHGFYTYNGLNYNNFYFPPGMGTSLDELGAALNLMDSPANNAGIHNYVSYNIGNPDWANRTITDGLAQLGIPAAAIIQHGAHWITVIGVKTDVVPVANRPYKILGFYVRDPWTGYQQVNPNGPPSVRFPMGKPLPPGLGENKFCGNKVNANRVAGMEDWDGLFNPAFGPPLPFYGSGLGYKFEVEPIGPVAEDTGNYGEYSSVPDPSPTLPNAPLTAADALQIGTNDLMDDFFLKRQSGFTNGTWEVTDAMLVQYPTDPADEGDWLIPYEGSGGPNDVTGFVLIDMETGDLDEAVWMNPGDIVPSMKLTEVETMETDEYAGVFEDDNGGDAQLTIQSAGNSMVLSWPDSDLIDYTLEQSDSINPANWVTLTNAPVAVGGTNQIVLPSTGGTLFFRLKSL